MTEIVLPFHWHLYCAAISFLFGAVVGSFCNVCICRWPAGKSVVRPRSRCPKCASEIAWYDNIPILSWFVLRGKCRNCALPISPRYPAIEALTGLLFMAVFLRFGVTVATPIYMLLCAAMVVVTFQDLADWTIPNEITLPGIPLGFGLSVLAMLFGPRWGLRVTHPADAALGIALGGGILYALDRVTVILLKKPGMGFGDVKLLAMLGAFIGWKGVLGTLIAASFIGSAVGVSLMAWYRLRGEAKTETTLPPDEEGGEDLVLPGHYLPFGPYLALGGLLFVFYGPELIGAYIALIQGEPIMGI